VFLSRAIGVCALLLTCACGESDGASGDGGPADAVVPVCAPGPEGAFWLSEGETVVIDVVCTTGLELAGSDFEVASLPRGATYDPTEARITWTPGLDQAAVYEVYVAAPRFAEWNIVTIGVADAWSRPDNVRVVDPLLYSHEYGLPVFFLSPSPTNDEDYEPCTIIYGGHVYDAEAKKRGKSSLDYPKNSYTLQFESNDLFSDPDRAGGFVDKRKVVLTTPFDDNSYIRTRLAFDLWNRLEPGPLEVQSFSAVVFLNGDYHGLYTVTDHIDRYLAYAVGLPASGNLYKAINHDANFRLTNAAGESKDTLHDGYEKKEGVPEEGQPGAFDDLEALVEFVATSEDGEFASDIASRIDVDNYVAWWLLVTFISAGDTAGKNSYHYHHADSLWYTAPWDFNAALGQNWYTLRTGAGGVETFLYANRLFERLFAAPGHGDAMRARYASDLYGAFDLGEVLAIVDDYVAEIDAGARRDEERWGEAYRSFYRWADRDDFTTYEQEIEYVRAWITQRWAVFDDAY